jgi:hypothetical protein
MTNIFTKLASGLTALALVATFVPAAAFAQDGSEDTSDAPAAEAAQVEQEETIVDPVIETPSEETVTTQSIVEQGETITVSAVDEATVSTEQELRDALASSTIAIITLGADISVTSTVEVNRSVTINGSTQILTGNFVKTSNSNNAVLLITVPGVTVTDLVVDGGGSTNNLHGINVYQASNVTLTGVTAKNANAGIIVNDSDVTVNDVITANNRWGGINVDKGTATLVVNGISSHNDVAGKPAIWKDDNALAGVSVGGSMSQYTESIQPVNSTTGTLYFLSTVKNEPELAAALANPSIPTITLGADISVGSTVAVNRTVTILGNGKTISASGSLPANVSVILITGTNVSISGLTVVGKASVHGIQAYVTTGVSLTDVTIKDNGKSGLLVNGSTVTVTNLTTSGNGWNGVNVDQGGGVTATTTLTVNGVSAHDEADAIWVDDITLTGVSVIDTNSQYVSSERAWVDGSTNLTGRVYVLAPEEQDNGGSGRSGGSRRVTTDTTGSVDGGQVLGAETYNFTVDLTIGSTGADVIALQQFLIDAGYLKIAAPTGYFGEMTRAAVAAWQAARNITPAAGYFGPISRAAMAATGTPAPTMSAEARAALIKDLLEKVLELQEKLDAMEEDAA